MRDDEEGKLCRRLDAGATQQAVVSGGFEPQTTPPKLSGQAETHQWWVRSTKSSHASEKNLASEPVLGPYRKPTQVGR